jgi:Holliday junction resolvase
VRRAAKVDGTQPAIVEALRRIGAWVLHLHTVGKGCPDLLVWNRGRYVLIECKSKGEDINKDQAEFIATCPGEVHVCWTPEEALRAVLGEEVMT